MNLTSTGLVPKAQQPPQPQNTPHNPPKPPPLSGLPQPLRLSKLRTPARRQPPHNRPYIDLLVAGRREDYINICVPLYEASISGNWEAAKLILLKREELVRFSITENFETALHVAASAQSTKFVEALVGWMEKEDLELQNKNGNTALCLAAAAGNVKMAEVMVKKNEDLLTIPGSQEMMPLYIAALFGHHDTVKYLYDRSEKMTGDCWTPQNQGWVLLKCIEADLFDVALKILEDRPELAENVDVFAVLARKPYAFDGIKPNIIWRFFKSISSVIHVNVGPPEKESEAMQILRIIWKNIIKRPKDEVDEILRGPHDRIMKDGKATDVIKDGKRTYSSQILFIAAEMGNIRFIVELIRQYPDLIWKQNDNNQSIFHIAVSHRRESIYNLLYEIGSMKDWITPLSDPQGNNMLHLVGKKAKKNRLQDVSGVAFQMQRELLWFKEVEAMIPPYRGVKNADGATPHELFTKNHQRLVSKGEKWMKGTASQCMVVATLIATMVFAVAFTIPGGYDQNGGLPMFLRKEAFIVFVISDAISLIFASASFLVFLSILTSRYAQQDFLKSLPRKLMMGLATLFVSIVTMLIAFSISFFVLFYNKLIWVPIVVSVLAALLVMFYLYLQYPLFVAVFRSTYGSRYLFKPKKRMLYYQNPKF